MNRLKSFAAILAFAACCNSYAISNQKIDELAKEFMAKNKVEGMSVAVIENGQANIRNYGIALNDPLICLIKKVT